MPVKNKQYLLDTNILIDILNGNPEVMEKLAHVGTQKCCMSTISLHDLYFTQRVRPFVLVTGSTVPINLER